MKWHDMVPVVGRLAAVLARVATVVALVVMAVGVVTLLVGCGGNVQPAGLPGVKFELLFSTLPPQQPQQLILQPVSLSVPPPSPEPPASEPEPELDVK